MNDIEPLKKGDKLYRDLPDILCSYMAKQDDTTLSYEEWKRGLKKGVTAYNRDHGTNFDSDDCIIKYCTPHVRRIENLMLDVEEKLPFFKFNRSHPNFPILQLTSKAYRAGETWEWMAQRMGTSVSDIIERLHKTIIKGDIK